MNNFAKTNLMTHEQKKEFVISLEKYLSLHYDEAKEQYVDKCEHDLTYSLRCLKSLEFDEDKINEIVEFLKQNGGYCDCEVIMNVICS